MQPILKFNIPTHANPVFPLTQEMCTSNVHKHISSYTHILHWSQVCPCRIVFPVQGAEHNVCVLVKTEEQKRQQA